MHRTKPVIHLLYIHSLFLFAGRLFSSLSVATCSFTSYSFIHLLIHSFIWVSSATITIYEIIQFSNPAEAPLSGGKGIKIIIFHTNSTGMLAPLNGVIAAGINNIQPNGDSELTAWRWESGIPLSTNTTTSTSITATSETNVTTAATS